MDSLISLDNIIAKLNKEFGIEYGAKNMSCFGILTDEQLYTYKITRIKLLLIQLYTILDSRR